MQPAMRVVVLRHPSHLLQASGTGGVTTSGLGSGDELGVSDQGGGSSILDR